MDMLLKGKRALITGSTSGIGAQCARVLAGEGVSVVINGRSADRAAAVTEEIRKVGGEAKFVLGDVTTEDGSNAVIEGAKSAFDGIDILVNNAAINRGDNFATTTDRAWDEVIHTNVDSLFAVTKPIYKQMIRQRKGSILNITSIGAMRALPTAVHYATSKAAMIGFTKCLSREAGTFGVKVNAIAAGIFNTDLAQSLPDRLLQLHDFWASSGRLGRPEELAEYAAFMVSDRNSFMNGEVVIVDGGAIT